VLGEPARHPAAALGASALATGVRAGQLLHARQGVRGADGAGGVGADHQLGDDQLIHLKFRRPSASPGSRLRSAASAIRSNYLCLAFLAGILVVMYLTPDLRLSVYLIPVWLAVLAIGYRFRQKNARYALGDGASAR
jgi:aromatic amino acid transport protein AroP